jgi:predicted RNA-binding Zn ribbon-like protein
MASAFGRPSGSRPLDFVNTLDWRDDPARRAELLPDAGAWFRWARHAGFPSRDARAVRHEAHRRRAIRLREALAVLLGAVVEGGVLPAAATVAFARETQQAWRHRELTVNGGTPAWRWRARTSAADRLLGDLVLEAAALLVSPMAARIRICAAEGCGWFFVDRSKAGRRRWCSMEACGNRAKVQQYRRRMARG